MKRSGIRKRLRKWMFATFGYVMLLVAAIVLLAYATLIWNVVIALPKEIAAPVIAGIFTLAVSMGTLIFSKYLERRRDIDQELRQQKLPVYEEFQTFWIKLLLQNKPGMTPVPEKDVIRFMAGFTPKLMLWGSDSLLRQYLEFRQLSVAASAQQPAGITKETTIAVMVAFEKVIFEIRSDLGHKNEGLEEGHLLSLFMNDSGSHVKDRGAATDGTAEHVEVYGGRDQKL